MTWASKQHVSAEQSSAAAIDDSSRLVMLWQYLASWMSRDGGITGPVVHRCDLTRLFRIHDTAWTQAAAIEGLATLYERSGCDYWLQQALRLADAQRTRLQSDGAFRWAGHEDDRFSSLISPRAGTVRSR